MKEVYGFDKYIGQKVLVAETSHVLNLDMMDESLTIEEYDVSENDTLIGQITKEAETMGLVTRVWLPNSMGTCDYDIDRLNLHITKKSDGSFEITSINMG